MFSIMRTRARGSCNAHEEKRRMFFIVFKHVFAGRNTQYLVVYLTLKSVEMIALNVIYLYVHVDM